MKKIAISVLVLLAMLLVSCADSMDTSDVLAARKAAEGDIKWDAKYVSDPSAIIEVIPFKSARNNASGKGVTKITSNAHSADCPDVYFRWENKQKDDGILLVKKEVFDTYKGFTLTAKVSSTYWDFPITIYGEDGKEIGYDTIDDLYVFSVPKGKWHYVWNNGGERVLAKDPGCDKNINMVFIGNWKKIKDEIPIITGETKEKNEYVISFEKIVTDANGVLPYELWKGDAKKFKFTVTHESGEVVYKDIQLEDGETTFTLDVPYDGNYTVTETIEGANGKYKGLEEIFVTPIKATKTITLISQASNDGVFEVGNVVLAGLGGGKLHDVWLDKLPGLKEAYSKGATFIWDIDTSWNYGASGSAIIHYSTSFTLTEAEVAAIKEFPVSFAADNAAVMFVNETRVKYTEDAILADIEEIEKNNFTDFSNKAFLGDKWQVVYNVDIAEYLVAGENVVKFFAANSDDNDGMYNETNNPCGLIFFGETVIETGDIGGAGVFVNSMVLGENKGKNGTTGIPGDKAHDGTNWFTFAGMDRLAEGAWVTYDVINTDNGNGNSLAYLGKVSIKKNGSVLEVIIHGENASYDYLFFTKDLDKNANSIANKGNIGARFTLPYAGDTKLYLRVKADFYRF